MSFVSEDAEYHDRRFRALTIGTARKDVIFDKCRWCEGPVWFADGNYLLWSDIPNNRIMRFVPDGTVDVFRADSNYANGHTRDREGRLVAALCRHYGHQVRARPQIREWMTQLRRTRELDMAE